MREVEFKVFREAAHKAGGRVAALRVPEGGELSRKEIDDYTSFVAIYGAKGLAYIKVNALEKGAGRLAVADTEISAGGMSYKMILERTGAQRWRSHILRCGQGPGGE